MQPIENDCLLFGVLNKDCAFNIFNKIEIKEFKNISLVCKPFNDYLKKLGERPCVKNPFKESMEAINTIVSPLIKEETAPMFDSILEKTFNLVSNPKTLLQDRLSYTVEELEAAEELSIKLKAILENEGEDKIQKAAELRLAFDQTPIGQSYKQKEQRLATEKMAKMFDKIRQNPGECCIS